QIEADLEIFVDEEEETIILFNHDRTEVPDLFPQAMMISTPTRAASSSSPLQSSFTKWHNRLGHPSIKKLRSLTSKLP
ncbi:hypothetical protein U1Q18_046780, partial [Sarracenia purpurea var. burkii]